MMPFELLLGLEVDARSEHKEVRRLVRTCVTNERCRIAAFDAQVIRYQLQPGTECKEMVVLEVQAKLVRAMVNVFQFNVRRDRRRNVRAAKPREILNFANIG